MKLIAFFLLNVLCSLTGSAQTTFSISGTIENSKGEKVASVTYLSTVLRELRKRMRMGGIRLQT